MIYRNSYFSKELRQAYIENRISTKRKAAFALFLGLLSFAAHFTLQTMTDSILSDTVPHIMQTSYFSTVHTYIAVAYFMYVLYFILYYDYLSFAELRKNRWYPLIKMSYEPLRMIFSKLAASIYSIFIIYTIGFVFTIVLTVFLKYNFIYAYLPSLYLVGLADLLVITVVAMAASLYVHNPTTARYIVFFSAVLLMILRMVLGYQAVVTDRVSMQNVLILTDFGKSIYLPAVGGVLLICLTICAVRARSAANYYSVPFDMYGYVLPEGETIVRADERTGKIRPLADRDRAGLHGRILDISVTAFLILFICAALAFNIFIIMLSASQPGKEVTIRGVIPYVFKSDTMEPAIMENDLAYFKRIDTQETVEPGAIVLFLEKNTVYVERIVERRENEYIVDIDHYPPMSQVGVMKKAIERSAIYGVFSHSNRWLGALILFANTIFGRLAFLFGPALFLFFYQPIKRFFARSIRQYMDD